MNGASQGLFDSELLRDVLTRQNLVAGALLTVVAVLLGIYIMPVIVPREGEPPLTTIEVSRVVYPAWLEGMVEAEVSRLIYPATLASELHEPVGGAWTMPAAAVGAGEDLLVADAGNDRILRLDQAGQILDTFDGASSATRALQMPMAIAIDGERLVVASSLAAEVLVLDLSGDVEQILSLPAGRGGRTPRPIGVAVTPDGGIAVSDADNHRVVRLDREGEVLWTSGTGTRAGGSDGFNVPGALAVDEAGNIYVADTLNGRVVKLSPEGAFVRQFGQLGDRAGTLSRPKGVVVDGAGRVFVSDGLLAAVEVFGPDGAYLGLIGRRDPADQTSGSLFVAPAGLWLAGDQLLVTDRFAGVLAFDLSDGISSETVASDEAGD